MSAQRRAYRGISARRMRTDPSAARGDGRPPGRDGRPATRNGAKVFNERVWAAITRSFNLSNREQQLVRGVFDDCTDFSIASGLGISPHTVHTHFERLYQKLGVANRAQLILRVVDEFLALTASPGSSLPPLCPNHSAGRCPSRRGRAPS
jgi:DNA-binding CsgD family transcriptional regulator